MGIKYFKEYCKQLDIDVDNIFCCGSSRATTNISNNSRYVFEQEGIKDFLKNEQAKFM